MCVHVKCAYMWITVSVLESLVLSPASSLSVLHFVLADQHDCDAQGGILIDNTAFGYASCYIAISTLQLVYTVLNVHHRLHNL